GQGVAVGVGRLLSRRGSDASGADAVATHDDRLRLTALVEIRGAERDRVFGTQLEDVADLDDPFHGERLAALRARLARLDRVQIDEARVEIPAGNDAAQLEPLAVDHPHRRPT